MAETGVLQTRFLASAPLRGTVRVPGDKSISHRALILASLAIGESRIHGLCGGDDVAATARALRALGATIAMSGDTASVRGFGLGAMRQPQAVLDLANSGTSARLLAGLVATHPVTSTFTGDASLSRRPMLRVVEPLRRFGAQIAIGAGGTLPMTVAGIAPAVPGEVHIAVPSAQLKSALILAALNTPGTTTLICPVPTRDHTERMLGAFGAQLRVEGERIAVTGEPMLRPQELHVPGDLSAAAFLIVAALIVPGSDVTVAGVGLNPRRLGLIRALEAMGADLTITCEGERGGEPVGRIRARHGPLIATRVDPAAVPDMIDELPAFFVAAAFAEGASRAKGLAELRVKESDRLGAMAANLRAIGVPVEVETDAISIEGSAGARLPGGAAVGSFGDHRIAMSMAVAGLGCVRALEIDDMAPVRVSFPNFPETLRVLTAS